MIGTGITPQPKSARARAAWREWTDQASAEGTLDFYGLQAQVARCMVIGGEAFVRFRLRRTTDGLTVPLQLQVLEGSEEHTSELQSLMRISYAVFCLKKKKNGRRYESVLRS